MKMKLLLTMGSVLLILSAFSIKADPIVKIVNLKDDQSTYLTINGIDHLGNANKKKDGKWIDPIPDGNKIFRNNNYGEDLHVHYAIVAKDPNGILHTIGTVSVGRNRLDSRYKDFCNVSSYCWNPGPFHANHSYLGIGLDGRGKVISVKKIPIENSILNKANSCNYDVTIQTNFSNNNSPENI
jgi:hypothetical protein